MPEAGERFVIQRCVSRDVWIDWTNPMSGQIEYDTHAEAVRALMRRANAVDYRIVRRVWTWCDTPVGLFR